MEALRGGRAVVTGASRGIGVHVALALADRGLDVALVARTGSSLEEVARRVEQRGVRAVAIPADLSDPTAPQRVLAEAGERLGGVDVLVNNAGLEGLGVFAETPVEHLAAMVQVNLTAALVLTRLALPAMLERGRGHVVTVASLMGKAAAPYHTAYAATKYALVGMNQALRLEHAGTGVGFSVVCPGLVRDEGMFWRIDRSAGRRTQALLGTTTPEAVARAVVRALRTNRPELIVTPKPIRPLLAVAALSPRLAERFIAGIGVTRMYRHAATTAAARHDHGA